MFTVPVLLPSTNTVRIPELTNKLYFNILKYTTNGDTEGLSLFFKQLLFKDYKLPKTLSYIDIIYILIYIRMVYVDPVIYILNSDGKDIKIELSVFLEKLQNITLQSEDVFTVDNIKVWVGLPTEMHFTNVGDVFLTTIKKIQIDDVLLEFDKLTEQERTQVLNQLPPTITKMLFKHFKSLNEQLGTLFIIEENKAFNITGVELNVLSNQLFQFVESIYSQSLSEYFKVMYHFLNKICQDSSFFMNMSPADSMLIFNVYQEEIKEQNEELKKQQM